MIRCSTSILPGKHNPGEVRVWSSLGTQSGWPHPIGADVVDTNKLDSVRADPVLSRKSSKRVQGGEPLPKFVSLVRYPVSEIHIVSVRRCVVRERESVSVGRIHGWCFSRSAERSRTS